MQQDDAEREDFWTKNIREQKESVDKVRENEARELKQREASIAAKPLSQLQADELDLYFRAHPPIPWTEKENLKRFTWHADERTAGERQSDRRMPEPSPIVRENEPDAALVPIAEDTVELAELRRRYDAVDAALPKGRYVCQICERRVARWPREKRQIVRLFGYTLGSFAYETPLACDGCRVMRFPQVRAAGRGRRRFWKLLRAVVTGYTPPSAPPWVARINQKRRHLLRH